MNQQISVTPEPTFAMLAILGLVIVSIAAIVAVATFTRHRGLRILAATIVSMAVALIAVALVGRFVYQLRQNPQSISEANALSSERVPIDQRSWDPATEEALQASIYSSPEAAAKALVRTCIQSLNVTLSESPVEIQIAIADPLLNVAPGLGTELSACVRESFPLSRVDHLPASVSGKQTPDTILMRVDGLDITRKSGAPWDPSQQDVSGAIRLSCQAFDFEELRRFTHKPWVEHFDEFVSRRPDHRLISTGSTGFALSEQEASGEARKSAARILGPMIADAAEVGLSAEIEESAARALDNEHLIIDQFTQQLTGSSGNVWRTRLLVDARPSELASLVSGQRTAARAFERRRGVSLMGIASLMGLTVMLYFVMNELTKGYLVWNLRFTAMLTMLALAVAFCWWMRVTV